MNELITAVLIAILSGGVGAAAVKLVGDTIAWKRERQATLEDRTERNTEERLRTIEKKTDAQSEALKFILYDRIRFLGQEYIAAKEIGLDERRILNDMHDSYHNGLGGNGDLDILMKEVNELPLRVKKGDS